MKIKLTQEEMSYITIAEGFIRTPIIDCVGGEDRITFVVEKGKLGKAVGKDARNIKKLEEIFKKEVRFVEYDVDIKQFIINLFKPFKLDKIIFDEKEKRASVVVNPNDKGKAIGKDGRNIKIIREIAKRHHGIEELKVL
ncbi:MAG: NusA-like transcription termination signal-binding factor [Thermoplasmatales archaeon]|nr:NusA-like transcription termination signal-binding factor [Thermoplasmatales archaeon]